MSPLSGCISGFAYPLENAILSTVSELVEDGVPDALESAPDIAFAPENKTVLLALLTP